MKSDSRNGSTVRLLALHTTEGVLAAAALRNYFNRPDATGSSHAGADSTGLLLDGAGDGFVAHDRAAWTLRNGNPVSENLELCGFAGWTRAEWLTRPLLLEAAAVWLARRHAATGVPLVKLTPAQVAADQAGVIGHVDWTEGKHDGTHWDCGPAFPWDVVIPRAQQLAAGATPNTTLEDPDMPNLTFISDAADHPWWGYDGFRRRYVAPGEPQLLVDLGQAASVMVKLIYPGLLARIPLDVPVDEAAIAEAVAARFATLTPDQRARELAYAEPVPDSAQPAVIVPPEPAPAAAPAAAAPAAAPVVSVVEHPDDATGAGDTFRAELGSNGPRVKAMQTQLLSHGYLLTVTGTYDGETAAAVAKVAHAAAVDPATPEADRAGLAQADGSNVGPRLARVFTRAGIAA